MYDRITGPDISIRHYDHNIIMIIVSNANIRVLISKSSRMELNSYPGLLPIK